MRELVEELRAAKERLAHLEKREVALRAALQTAGIDPDAVLTALLPVARPAVEKKESVADAGAFASVPTHAGRALAQRLADELLGGIGALKVRAASRLVDVAGEAAVEPILAAAAEVDGAARAALLEQAGRTRTSRARRAAKRWLDDASAEVRAAAVEVLVGFEDPSEAMEALRRGLQDTDPRVRRRATVCATSTRGIDAGMLVVPLLSDPDRQVRRVACTALGGTREPVAALALIGALLDDDPAVCGAAGAALERLFGEEAAGIATLPPAQRLRAVARLRAWVSSRLAELAPQGKLIPPAVRRAPSEEDSLLEELLDAADPFDDRPDPEVQASFARVAARWRQWEEADEAAAEARAEVAHRDSEAYDDSAESLGADDAADVAAEERARGAQRDSEAPDDSAESLGAEEAADAAVVRRADSAQRDSEAHDDSAESLGAEEAADATAEKRAVSAQRDSEAPDDSAESRDEPTVEPAAQKRAGSAQRDSGSPNDSAESPPEPEAAAEADPAPDRNGESTISTGSPEPMEAAGGYDPADGPAFEEIEAVLRAALRGSTEADLASELDTEPEALAPILAAHVEAGRLVRRGKKLFLP